MTITGDVAEEAEALSSEASEGEVSEEVEAASAAEALEEVRAEAEGPAHASKQPNHSIYSLISNQKETI